MVSILTYSLVALGLLWFIDELLTVLDLRLGMLEGNPIVKNAIKHGKMYFTGFKLFTFIGYVALILFINSVNSLFAAALTMAAVFMYLVVVVRNFVFYEIK